MAVTDGESGSPARAGDDEDSGEMGGLRGIDPNLVVVLDAVLTSRNLTHASERLGMTRSAVGTAMARLREQYDDQLLVRNGRVFDLTPVGQRLQPLAARAMAEIHRTLEVSPAFDPATSTRTFYISGSDYALGELTGPLQERMRARAPHVRVSFDSLPRVEHVTPVDLLRRDVMIAGTGRGVPGKSRPLFLDRFVCIAAGTNSRLRDGTLSLDDLSALRHVHSTFGTMTSTHVDDMLHLAGVEPQVAITVEGFLPVPSMVAGTELVGFVPERIAQRYAPMFGLVVAETPVAPMTLIEAAYWHPSRDSDPALRWLVRLLLEASEVVEFGGS